jgi:hypothetical protein
MALPCSAPTSACGTHGRARTRPLLRLACPSGALESEWSEGGVVARCGKKGWCGAAFIGSCPHGHQWRGGSRRGRRGAGSGWRRLGGSLELGGAAGVVSWAGGDKGGAACCDAVRGPPRRAACTAWTVSTLASVCGGVVSSSGAEGRGGCTGHSVASRRCLLCFLHRASTDGSAWRRIADGEHASVLGSAWFTSTSGRGKREGCRARRGVPLRRVLAHHGGDPCGSAPRAAMAWRKPHSTSESTNSLPT